ncbi:hypothetical protein [Hydrocarboniphaga sp.]|uniref:hypothetical protein n=1 Tax=Hydrocarboniphaga sp. TaxID=2033016 RepID=UPI003D099E17
MNAMLLKNAFAALTLASLAGCVSYAQTDLASAGYADNHSGAYVSVGIFVDAQTRGEIKPSFRDEPNRLAIRANHPLMAQLNCGEKDRGVSYALVSKYYKLTVEKNAHMSYAPLITEESGSKTCRILMNIVGADGQYIKHEFDTEVHNTSDGVRVYEFKPVEAAADAGSSRTTTEEIPKPR